MGTPEIARETPAQPSRRMGRHGREQADRRLRARLALATTRAASEEGEGMGGVDRIFATERSPDSVRSSVRDRGILDEWILRTSGKMEGGS
jgi:hypothetical protein